MDPDRLSLTEAVFQISEAIDDAMVFALEHREQMVQRVHRCLRRKLLPERPVRINRREIKQVYNKYKSKKRDVPHLSRSKLMNALNTLWSLRFAILSLPPRRWLLPLSEMY